MEFYKFRMFLGCFFQDWLQTPVGIHLLFPMVANPWLLKLNLIWETVKIIWSQRWQQWKCATQISRCWEHNRLMAPVTAPWDALHLCHLVSRQWQHDGEWRQAGPSQQDLGLKGSPSAWLNISQNCAVAKILLTQAFFHSSLLPHMSDLQYSLKTLPAFLASTFSLHIFLASAQQIQPIVPGLVKGWGVVINLFNNGQFQSTNSLATGSGLPW